MGTDMRTTRRVWAFVSGALLYLAALSLAQALAASPWPPALLDGLGGSGSLGALLGQSLLIAALLSSLALVWAYLTVRPMRGQSRSPTTAWCLAGMVLAWLLALIAGVIELSANTAGYQPSLSSLLLSSTVPPLWGLLNVLAVLAGILGAGRWADRARRQRKRTDRQVSGHTSSDTAHPA